MKGFHWVKYARRKPAARNGAKGTSTPILEPRGLLANSATPITAPIQNEKMKPESAAEPTRSASPNTSGASANPMARPRDRTWRATRLIAMRAAGTSAPKKSPVENANNALAAMNTQSKEEG